jgi:PAS domain S-box-containing protein
MTPIFQKEIFNQQVSQVFQQAIGALIGMPAVALVTILLLWQPVNETYLLVWLFTIAGITVLRLLLLTMYRVDTGRSDHALRWSLIYAALELISGISWAALVYWLFPANPVDQVLVMLILGAMAVGALPLLASVRWIYWSYLVPLACITATFLYLNPGWYTDYLATFTLIFALVLMVSSQNMFLRNRKSIELVLHNNRLVDSLSRANDRLERQFAQTKQAERIAREAEAQYKTLANATNEGVLLYKNLTITDANQQLCDMLGYSPDELTKLPIHELFEANSHPYVEQMFSSNEDIRFESSCIRKDKSSFPVEVNRRSITVNKNKFDVITFYDITELKRMASVKDQFISTVSHELRTPLTSIHASLGMLGNKIVGELNDKQMELVGIASTNSERLKTLVNDLLDMQQMDNGTLSFHMEEIDLSDLLYHVVNINQGYASEHKTRFVILQDYPSVYIHADRNRLTQVLTNLLSNAAKYSPQGQPVEIELDIKKDSVTTRISDHGPGIAVEFQDKIFERFSQADSSDTRAQKGSGLGLYISKTIIEQLQGEIGYKSELGKGSCFYFSLPLARNNNVHDIHAS